MSFGSWQLYVLQLQLVVVVVSEPVDELGLVFLVFHLEKVERVECVFDGDARGGGRTVALGPRYATLGRLVALKRTRNINKMT